MPLEVTIDSTTWAALALVLAVIGAALSWVAWKRRGLAAGVRGLAWTLVPVALWLTGTLKLAANILEDVATWASRLVFSPAVWAGIIVAGASAALFLASSLMRARGIGAGAGGEKGRGRGRDRGRESKPVEARRGDGRENDLDDMADIEAILKKHGI
jgi:hypothetical protein